MIGMNSRLLRLLALLVALAVLGVACGGGDEKKAAEDKTAEPAGEPEEPAAATGPDTPAALLRSNLNGLFQEHVVLAAAATNAALGARNDEFGAAAGAIDANSAALTAAITSVFGEATGKAFDGLWKSHIGFVVNYTQGLGGKDKAKQDQAVNDLLAYTKDFGAFINSALPDLPVDAVAELVKTHILTLKDAIDAQAAKDQAKAYTDLRKAAEHMGGIAEPLSASIAAKFPDKVSGDAKSPAAGLVTTLNVALREHVFLAAGATGAALGARQEEFMAAAAALEANSDAVAAAIGSVYGAEVGKAFDGLWKSHIGFVVDYTTGVAGKDKAKQDKAVQALLAYTKDFGAFINTASPALPTDTVAELVKTHILTLKDVIDAQAAKDFTKAYAGLRTAADHMAMIASGLSGAIVKQFPDKF